MAVGRENNLKFTVFKRAFGVYYFCRWDRYNVGSPIHINFFQ
jgi:hypothetical protein